jgi:CheY-like chemotaxis protein
LLVDDDPRLLAALRRALHSEPYELLDAASPGAALWVLSTRHVDVLVTDEQMPGMSGTEFLTRVRAEYPHVISIMLTGHADLRTAMSAINSGEVYRFFTKPCDAGSLAVAIRHALQLRMLIRQTRRLLDLVRRKPFGHGPVAGVDDMLGDPSCGMTYDDDPTPTIVYEVDETADLGTLLREIETELGAVPEPDRQATAGDPSRPGPSRPAASRRGPPR